ncbi:uncharacterized protein M421DRAFT_103375 [Didymella exigua CBS 183.55]|uniref:Uncharacterized protein n=1 Tax=Didymella exigua CBS 183.55 TaxID=1150837 RepID=A0A6A5RBW1_9PLEO|nr:uncharacterized protein M421DRAFT_103375 [Didymella exigua CBS 183.55]KAF1925152.1 hypothetical protein M421DRAFT_103375 [Didymella exigua CBS 183.55]
MAEPGTASPEQAGSSRAKRPAPMTRQSSSQSHISQSPSEKGHHRPQQHKVVHRHVAGGRMQRTASTGKNLGKAGKATQHTHTQAQAQGQAADEGGRHHRRSQSGTSLSVPSSPRPGFKRNASSGAIMRHNPSAHAHAGLRKNHSSGHLVGKAKGGKSSKDLAPAKGKLGNPSRSRQVSPEERPIVHFDVGNDDDDGDDDDEEGGWTEESASQSPNTTRSNTRSSSVAAEAQRVVDDATESNTRANAGDALAEQTDAPTPAPAGANATYTLPERVRPPTQTPRAASSHHSRQPDADLITSRLLQRSASHTVVAPQPSSVSATVQHGGHQHSGHQLGTSVGSASVGSTLVDTPGRDLVSRFMDGDGSAGTPYDGSYMAGRRASRTDGGPTKSPPNVAEHDEAADTPTRPHSLRSGATTPNLFPSAPNRTQNKLLLQRAASAIEPHAPVPAILRSAGPSFHNIGLSYPGEGRLDPRLQQQFNHVAIEYSVVQRYRNPLADSILRLQQIPGMLRKLRASKPGSAHGGSALGTTTLSSSIHENGDMDGAGSRRSRAGSAGGADETPRNEAQELCRSMWDSAQITRGD